MPMSKKFDRLVQQASSLAYEDECMLGYLIRARRDAGETQQQLAARLGWTTAEVSDFESHWYDPTLSEVRRYALAVGVEITHSYTKETNDPG